LKSETFNKFKNIFIARYGQWSMPEEMQILWFEKLEHLDDDQFEETYQLMLKNDRQFYWADVIERVKHKFPELDPVKKLEREWQKTPKNESKQTQLNKITQRLISEVKEAKRLKQSFDFMANFVPHFIRVFGERDAFSIASKSDDMRFKQLVNESLRK